MLAKKFPIHAAGGVDAVGAIVAPAPNNYGGFTVAGPAASVFSITLSDPIAPAERIILAFQRGVLNGIAVPQLVGETNTLVLITTGVSSTGAAADRAFDFAVIRVAF